MKTLAAHQCMSCFYSLERVKPVLISLIFVVLRNSNMLVVLSLSCFPLLTENYVILYITMFFYSF